MRIEYFEPKLEIIDLLDADIVTASGDNGFDFGDLLDGAKRLLGLNPDDVWSSNDDSWDGFDSWN